MSHVYKATITVDEPWLKAVQDLFSYVQSFEVARIEAIEPAGVTEDYLTKEELLEFNG